MTYRNMFLIRGAAVLGLAAAALGGAVTANADRPYNFGDCVSEGGQPPVVNFSFGPTNLQAEVASESKTQSTGRPSNDAARFDNYGACGD